jgi:cation:H+ antiporter
MEIVVHFAWLLAGLAMLTFGADWLVKGASDLALRARIKPLVVGLTVVAFGTSAPELLVSLKANLDPQTRPDIAVGNVIGSNICNIGLVLGIAALISPLVINRQILRRELPILLVVTAVFVIFIWDRELSRWEGAALAAGIVIYVVHSIFHARNHPEDPMAAGFEHELREKLPVEGAAGVWASIGWLGLGLAGLIFGADRLVVSGVEIAVVLGVPELVIGLTMVAVGTSLPELATTVAASRRGETDLIAGNLIGSNLFNILAVMGITGTVKAISLVSLAWVDLAVMGGFTLVLVPFLLGGARLNRIEGGLMLGAYLLYCVYLVKPEWLGV